MEKFLLDKLDALTSNTRHVLDTLNNDILSNVASGSSYMIEEASLTLGKSEIIILPHGRVTPTPLHRHNYVEIMIVVNGGFRHNIDGRQILLSEGDVLFMNRHVSHSIDLPGASDSAFNIIMSSHFLATMAPELGDTVFSKFIEENAKDDGTGIFLHFKTKGKKQLENLVENLLYELTEYTADGLVLFGTANLIFRYLSLKSGELLVDSTALNDKHTLRMQAIAAYVRCNYRTANLPELSEKIGLTVPYLSKLINTHFGKSFKEIVIDERMARALEMLHTTTIPIGSIIRNVGYENASYFHREFRRRTEKTPLAVRNKK